MHQLLRLKQLARDSLAHVQKTTETYDLYLRKDGNDSNDGRTEATAKLTTKGITDLLPGSILHRRLIHISPGTYAPPELGPKFYGERIIWNADGAGIGDGTTTVFASEASGAGSDLLKIEKVGGGLTPGAHIGESILMESGDAINSRRDIVDNDASFFYVARRFGSFGSTLDPSPGDTYRVFTNSVRFEQTTKRLDAAKGFGSTDELSFPAPPGGVAYIGITFGYDGSNAFVSTHFDNCTTWFFGCKIDTTGVSFNTFETAGGTIMGGSDTSSLGLADWPFVEGLVQSPTHNEDLAGWGIAEIGQTLTFYILAKNSLASIAAWVNMSAVDQIVGGSKITLMGRLYGRAPFLAATVLTSAGTFQSANDRYGFLQIDASSTFDALRVMGEGYALITGAVRINNSGTGRLALAQSGGRIRFENDAGTPVGVTGGTVAVEAREGGTIHLEDTPALDGDTPGTDWVVAGTAVGRSNFVNAGDVIVASPADGSVIQKVNGPFD